MNTLLNIIMIIGVIVVIAFIGLCVKVFVGFFKFFVNLCCTIIDPKYPRDNK